MLEFAGDSSEDLHVSPHVKYQNHLSSIEKKEYAGACSWFDVAHLTYTVSQSQQESALGFVSCVITGSVDFSRHLYRSYAGDA